MEDDEFVVWMMEEGSQIVTSRYEYLYWLVAASNELATSESADLVAALLW
jgi:hypothetical protein